ncbi:MAG: hypothetical protein CSA58_12870 [Micrococcales bacterium]|nr:MAG: hypothetical protein CSA58_12870 [Micrococcales bacterium]
MTTQSTSTANGGAPTTPRTARDLVEQLRDQGLDPDSISLAAAVGSFVSAYQRWERLLTRHDGISVARLRLMWLLRDAGPLRLSDLRDSLGVTARNVTQLVDGLEANGLVRRRPHPTDRRAMLVELADGAEDMVEVAMVSHSAEVAMLFQRLDPDDRSALLALVTRLTGELEAMGVTMSKPHDTP